MPVRPPSRKQSTGTPVSGHPRSSSIKQPQPVQASSLPENTNVHTTPRQSHTPSAARPLYQVPPDGYIPTVEAGSVISLPPPHELTRHFNPTPTDIRPQGGWPGSAHSSRRNDMQDSETIRERSRTPGRARSPSTVSGESRSTTISQYEFVRPPPFSPRPEGMDQQWQPPVSNLHDITDYENSLNSMNVRMFLAQ